MALPANHPFLLARRGAAAQAQQQALAQPVAAPAPDPLADPLANFAYEPLTPEDERSILGQIGSGSLSLLAGAANFADLMTGGSFVRDVVTGQNPFDQLLTPFSHVNRATGRDVLTTYGITQPNDPTRWEWGDFAGFGAEVLLDPFGPLGPAAARVAGLAPKAVAAASAVDAAGDVARAAGAAGDVAQSAAPAAAAASDSFFSGPTIGYLGYKKAYDAIPQSAKDVVWNSPIGEAGRFARRIGRGLFNGRYMGQTDELGQELGASVYDANEAVNPAARESVSKAAKAYGETEAEFLAAASEDAIRALSESPLVPDRGEVLEYASEIAEPAIQGYATSTAISRFKAENPGIVSRVRAIHRRGGDWTELERSDEIFEAIRSADSQASQFDSVVREGEGSLSDEDIWYGLLNPRGASPRVRDFIPEAESHIVNSATNPQSPYFKGVNNVQVRPHMSVEIHKPSLARRFGEKTDDMISGMGEVPDRAFGHVIQAGSRESKVLIRGADGTFNVHTVPNNFLAAQNNPEIALKTAVDYVQMVSSQIMRHGEETMTRDPQSFETALQNVLGDISGLGDNFELDMARYQPLFNKYREMFGSVDQPVGVGSAVQWTVNGADQWVEPKIVNAIEAGPDGRQYAFLDGESTAVPLDQLAGVRSGVVSPDDIVRTEGTITELRNTLYSDLGELGLDVKNHDAIHVFDDQLDEAIRIGTDYSPRYGAKAASEGGFAQAKKNFETRFGSAMARNPVTRDMTAKTVNKLFSDPKYRGEGAAVRILEDFGEELDPRFGMPEQPASAVDDIYGGEAPGYGGFDDAAFNDGTLPGMADDAFDPAAMDAMDDAARAVEDIPYGREVHAEALADLVSGRRLAELYRNSAMDDTIRYLKNGHRVKAATLGLHKFLNAGVTKATSLGADAPQRLLKDVYESIPGFNLDSVRSYYQRAYGTTAEQFDQLRVPAEYADLATGYQKFLNPQNVLTPGVDKLLKSVLDPINRLYKGNLTSPFPAFHVRNRTGGAIQNLLIGGVLKGSPTEVSANLADYWAAHRSVTSLVENAAKGQLTPEQLNTLSLAYKHGVIDPRQAGYGVETMPRSATDIMSPVSIVPPPLFGKRSGVMPEDVVFMGDRGSYGRVVSAGDSMASVLSRNPETGLESVLDVPIGQLTPQNTSWWPSRAEATQRVAQAEVPGILQPIANKPGIRQARIAGEQVFGAGSNTGRLVEFYNRMEMFEYLLKKGKSAEDAARTVEKLHFDYSKGAPFENEIAKRLFLFYTFTRRMAGLTADTLIKDPAGPLGVSLRASRLATQDMQDSGVGIPEYVAQNASIPLGVSPDGTRSFITGFGLQHEDPLSFGSVDRESGLPNVSDMFAEGISRLNPGLKMMVESAAGESFFQRGPMGGRDLIDMDPTLGRLVSNVSDLTGFGPLEDSSGKAFPVGGQNFEFLFANSPLSRYGSTLRTLTDPRKYDDMIPGASAAVNLLTGGRVTDISPAAQDAVTREYAQMYARKHLGAKAYETVRVPKEEIAKVQETDPERARQMQIINQMQQVFKRRREEREAGAAGTGQQSALPPGG